ncbi:hypothetical protein ACPV5G_20750, partial [Photobacterium damselae]|uniref:hypothetical protein n=1 Tax=Photobacterium damselae TaxID=38293 RepID=UPI00406888BF
GYDVIKMKYLEDFQSASRVSAHIKEELGYLSCELKNVLTSEIIALICDKVAPSHTNHALSQYRAHGAISNNFKYQQKLITKKLKSVTANGDEDAILRYNQQLTALKAHTNSSIKRRIHCSDKCPRCQGTGRIGANLYQCPSCDGQGTLKYRVEILSRYIRNQGIKITQGEADKLKSVIDNLIQELNHKVWIAVVAISKQKQKELESD